MLEYLTKTIVISVSPLSYYFLFYVCILLGTHALSHVCTVHIRNCTKHTGSDLTQGQDEGYIYNQDINSEDDQLNISVCYIQMFTLYHWKREFV